MTNYRIKTRKIHVLRIWLCTGPDPPPRGPGATLSGRTPRARFGLAFRGSPGDARRVVAHVGGHTVEVFLKQHLQRARRRAVVNEASEQRRHVTGTCGDGPALDADPGRVA